MLTLSLVAHDPNYLAADWLVRKLRIHREALDETFHQPDVGRVVDMGWEWSGDE